MRRILLLLVVLGFTLGGCGDVEWFPEQGVSAFSFDPASVSDVATGSIQISPPITVKMGDASADISVTGGEFSIDGGTTFTATAAKVKDRDTVVVRHTAAATAGQTTRTTLTIGNKSATFSSTTGVPLVFAEDVRFNVEPGTVQTSGAITVTVPDPTAISVSGVGGEYKINDDGPFTSAAGFVNNGDRVIVRHNAANGTTATAVTTTLTIGSKTATFTTTTASALPQTVTGSGAEGIHIITPITIRVASGSHIITIDGFGTISADGDTFFDPPLTLTLTDKQTIYLSDAGFGTSTIFFIDGVPLTYNVTAVPATASP